jgi:hypothetical protein
MDYAVCSLGLNTRVKDKRNFLANYSHYLDKTKIQYTKSDDDKKCEIFGIEKNNIDFVSHHKMGGIGDHYYPLGKGFRTQKRIGSDSGWNMIPVSGSNQNYKKNPDNLIIVNKWIEYCNNRGATLFHDLNENQISRIEEGFAILVSMHEQIFADLITNQQNTDES